MLVQYLDKKIRIIDDDDKTWAGQCIDVTSSEDNDDGGESITIDVDGQYFELNESEIKQIDIVE